MNIKTLEEEIGYQIFLRQKGQIVPAPSGILFLEWGKMVLDSHGKTFDRIKDINDKRIGKSITFQSWK